MKSGIKTSEFWASVLSSIVLLFVAYGMVNHEQEGAWLALVTAVAPIIAYTISRASVKKSQ